MKQIILLVFLGMVIQGLHFLTVKAFSLDMDFISLPDAIALVLVARVGALENKLRKQNASK